jgi:hypothetical protein
MLLVLRPLLFGLSRTVARASRFEVRASINGTAVEVPDVS